MIVLGVESSCDETAAAIVEDGIRVLSDVVFSQISVHSPYGGVVPELASRKHVEAILPVIAKALEDARIPKERLDIIAVTRGPGLIGALLVGLCAAKSMAWALGKPLVGVNHLEAHMHSAFLGNSPLDRPFVCLVVSGGHTALYLVNPGKENRLLGCTRDDAAGEALDKAAKLLNLGYPGGAVIDRLSVDGNPAAFQFPKAYLEKESLDFSFSGIKTALANFVRRHGSPASDGQKGAYRLEDLAASFQEAIVEVLVDKTMHAVESTGVNDVAIVGGVAANGRLRYRMVEETAWRRVTLHMPLLRFCTDNAVMVAAAGYHVWNRFGPCENLLELDAVSRWT